MKKIIFVNDPIEIIPTKFTQGITSNCKIYSLNYRSHKALTHQNIDHFLIDEFLNEDDRNKLFHTSLKLADSWYENPITKNLEYQNVNILGLVDTFELQMFLIHKLILFLIIKRIIDKEKPEIISASGEIESIVKVLIQDKQISLEPSSKQFEEKLIWDKIELMFNIGSKPISIKISRFYYNKIKDFLELIICKLFNLDYKFNDKTNNILFIEFNPSSYSNFIENLKEKNIHAIIFNRRRPAISNFKSINVLRKFNCKVLSPVFNLSKKEKKDSLINLKKYEQNLQTLWNQKEFFDKKFSIEGISFWSIVKNKFVNSYNERLYEYLNLITLSKKILKDPNISKIFLFYEIGTTEKSILKVNEHNIPTIVHQHGFDNLTSNLAKYDPLEIISLKSDKIAVYGSINKKYLEEYQKINPSRILVTGSPRHDSFFENIKTNFNPEKVILITPIPFTEFTAQPKIVDYDKFERVLKDLIILAKKIKVKVIVKLHPSQEDHNEDIKKIISKLDETIPIFQLNPSSYELISKADVVVNINPESYNSSTIIMESMILQKPTMTIFLDDQFHDLEYVIDDAVIVATENSDLKKLLNDILHDDNVRNKLIQNANNYLKKYLKFHGDASEESIKNFEL